MTDRTLIPESAVAVVGIGCWYPDAPNPSRLWENVLARRRAFRRLPAQRLPLDAYHDPDSQTPDKTYGRRAAVIDGFEFDWMGRRIPKRTFEGTDIAHWLALEVALQALWDSGYGRGSLPRQRTGVIVGNTLTGEQSRSINLRMRWPFVERAIRAAANHEGMSSRATRDLVDSTRSFFKSVFPAVDEDTLAGSLSNTIAGRICNFLDLQGGGYTVDGACASSLLAVTNAANVLSNGDLDVALVGGVDISLDPFELVGFAKVGALSPTQMRVYDRAANGFVPGEGCGFVVLKRLGDARADGDYVYATLRGWGVSSDGAGGITAPSVAGQALAIRRAYKRAGYSPELVDFVEGHGTGTPAGDPVELKAIASAMEAYGVRDPRQCGVTSFKSIVGHTKAAAGIGGFIKAVVAVNRRVIPPTSGCVDPNATFADDARVLYPVKTGHVDSPDEVIRAGVSAMGFGGINTHVTIESCDPPASRLRPSLDEDVLLASAQDTELFVMSAASVDALKKRVERVAARADGASMGELSDLAAELSREAAPDGPVRAAVIASDPDELEERFQEVLDALNTEPPAEGTVVRCPRARHRAWLSNAPQTPRVGFLFPGQGSQQLGMARQLVRRFDWAKRFAEQTDAWLVELGREPVTPLVFRPVDRAHDEEQVRGWARTLRQTEHAQPAICFASAMWLKYFARLGLTPDFVGGHSLGELSAFHAAGALDERALLQLAATRGRIMAGANASGTMANLSCTREETEALIAEVSGYATVANLNAPDQTVVSGDRDSVEQLVELAKKRSVAAVLLNVSAAFHSAHFHEAAHELREADAVPEISSPMHTPAISAIDGAEIRTGVSMRDYLARQMCAEVDFVRLVREMEARCDLLVEVGPGRVLSSLVKRTAGDERLRCFPVASRPGKDEDLNVAIAALFVGGRRLRLDALYEGRLSRPFTPASEKTFIESLCERPFVDEDAPRVTTSASHRPALSVLPREAADEHASVEPPHRSVIESQIVKKPSVHGAVLASVEAQTGFPIESLTLDLRLVDDLHLDSIKTVELVSEVADQLQIAVDFDAAQFADVTLGELVERMEALQADSSPLPSSDSEGAAGATNGTPERERPWVANFALEWKESPLPPAREDNDLKTGRALLMAPDPSDDLVTSLARELEKRGIDLMVSGSELDSDAGAPVDHVLVVSPDATDPDDVVALRQVVELYTGAARRLPSTGARPRGPSCVAWIRARSSESQANGHADWAADAFAATVHLERRQLRVRSLDFADADRQPGRIADALLEELADDGTFEAARYDREGRRSVGVPTLQGRAAHRRRATAIGADDVVLVTGGAKGITAECALALGRETRAKMVLVGSSPAPDDGSADEIGATLAKFRKEGLRCDYRQCDLAVRDQVHRLVADVQRDFGSLDAVVHGAGLNRPRPVEEPDAAEVLSEIEPKLAGALHLFEALDSAPPKMFVALTSIIGVVGMPRNAWYGFANQALDRSLGRFAAHHPSVETVSVAYSIWDEVGMGAKLGSIERLAKLGIDAIPVEEGVTRFVELVTHDPGTREVIVAARLGGLDTWRPALPSLPRAHRFIDQIVRLEPGRELVCRTKLDLDRDPYVEDHVYEGSRLLPAVFGIEAMSEAVAHVTGRSELPFPLRLEDVELTRPLVVHPERGLLIEIRAQVDEGDLLEAAEQRVRAEVRCQQTGFSTAHFSACFVFGADVAAGARPFELPAEGLPIRPREHLYGSVLFQGPRFQRIEEVFALDAHRCVFAAQRDAAGESWLLGDPYFRDALLQSLQLCVVPDQCLPVRIDRWDIHGSQAKDERGLAQATIDGHEDDTYIGAVSAVSADGAPLESLFGYRARTLTRREEWPSAVELATRGSAPVVPLRVIRGAASENDVSNRVNQPEPWDGGVFYRDVPGYGHEGQTAFFCRFPLSAQDSSSVSGSLSFTSYFRWAGKLREWGGMNTPGVYEGILEMLGSNSVMSATNECETRILKVPQRNDFIEGRYWMEYVNKGDAGNIFEWWRIPFPSGKPEMVAWTKMRISAVKAVRHGVIAATDWPEFLYRFLKDMGDDAPEPTLGPDLALDLGATLFAKVPGPQPGPLLAEQTFTTAQEDSNVVGNIYFANYSVWQGRLTDGFFHSLAPHLFEERGKHGELHRAQTRISQLRDAVPFDAVGVLMRLEELYERGARLSFEFFRKEPAGVTKIAAGRNLIAWATLERGAAPQPLPWPQELRDALLAVTGQSVRISQGHV